MSQAGGQMGGGWWSEGGPSRDESGIKLLFLLNNSQDVYNLGFRAAGFNWLKETLHVPCLSGGGLL